MRRLLSFPFHARIEGVSLIRSRVGAHSGVRHPRIDESPLRRAVQHKQPVPSLMPAGSAGFFPMRDDGPDRRREHGGLLSATWSRTIGLGYPGDGEETMTKRLRWYRVEHHDRDQIRALDRIADVYPHHTTLTPFLSRLLLTGVRRGELLLIEEATERTVARLVVQSSRRRT
jgi:hypothetical protein